MNRRRGRFNSSSKYKLISLQNSKPGIAGLSLHHNVDWRLSFAAFIGVMTQLSLHHNVDWRLTFGAFIGVMTRPFIASLY